MDGKPLGVVGDSLEFVSQFTVIRHTGWSGVGGRAVVQETPAWGE